MPQPAIPTMTTEQLTDALDKSIQRCAGAEAQLNHLMGSLQSPGGNGPASLIQVPGHRPISLGANTQPTVNLALLSSAAAILQDVRILAFAVKALLIQADSMNGSPNNTPPP